MGGNRALRHSAQNLISNHHQKNPKIRSIHCQVFSKEWEEKRLWFHRQKFEY